MSDDLESAVRFFEQEILRRPLTPEGRAEFEKAWLEWKSHPADAYQELADKLRARQGTVFPDFETLYRRKAELDNEPRP
jgi:hypothetical protein